MATDSRAAAPNACSMCRTTRAGRGHHSGCDARPNLYRRQGRWAPVARPRLVQTLRLQRACLPCPLNPPHRCSPRTPRYGWPRCALKPPREHPFERRGHHRASGPHHSAKSDRIGQGDPFHADNRRPNALTAASSSLQESDFPYQWLDFNLQVRLCNAGSAAPRWDVYGGQAVPSSVPQQAFDVSYASVFGLGKHAVSTAHARATAAGWRRNAEAAAAADMHA
eukprot:1855529-Pleurochrysis_carterae.AAC.2